MYPKVLCLRTTAAQLLGVETCLEGNGLYGLVSKKFEASAFILLLHRTFKTPPNTKPTLPQFCLRCLCSESPQRQWPVSKGPGRKTLQLDLATVVLPAHGIVLELSAGV